MKKESFNEVSETKKETKDELYGQWIPELEVHENQLDEVVVAEQWSEFPKHMTVSEFIRKLKDKDSVGKYVRWRFLNH